LNSVIRRWSPCCTKHIPHWHISTTVTDLHKSGTIWQMITKLVSTHVHTVLKPEARHTEQHAQGITISQRSPCFQTSLSFAHYNHSRHWHNSSAAESDATVELPSGDSFKTP
jgi:hypothetical protein